MIKDSNTRITITLDKKLVENLDKKALKSGRSRSNYILQLIKKDFENK